MSKPKDFRPYPGAMLNPKVDPIFKSLFTQNSKDSNEALKSFLAAMLNHSVTKGMDWDKVPEAVIISVINFIYDEENPDGFLEYTMRLRNGKNLKSTRMKIIFLELPKYINIPDAPLQKLTAVQKWAKFFLYANCQEKQEYLKLLAESEVGIMYAHNALNSISQNKAE